MGNETNIPLSSFVVCAETQHLCVPITDYRFNLPMFFLARR
jgi:hypothetical protein